MISNDRLPKNFTYHRNGHRYDDKIRDDISRSEHCQHIQGIGALCQEDSNRRPVAAPVQSALEHCRQEECDTPRNDYTNHDPAGYVEGPITTENSSVQEENGKFDESKGNLLGRLETIFVLATM